MHIKFLKNLKRKAHPSSIRCSHRICECSLPGTLLAWEESEPQEQAFLPRTFFGEEWAK